MRFGLAFFFIASVSNAATTLKSAYESALVKNESIGIKHSESQASEERVSGAFGKILPSISLIGSYTRQDAPTGILNSVINADQWSARANITQPLFHGLSEFAQYRSLNAKARSQKALEKNTRLNLYTNTASAYYDLLAAKTDLETIQTLFDLTNKRVKDIRDRAKIGRSKKGDRLSAEAQSQSLAAQLEGAKIALKQAEENFALVTGLPGPFSLENEKALPQMKGTQSELLKKIEERPDIISAKEEATAADESISVSKGTHYPQIDAFGNYYFDRTGTLKDVKWDLGVTVTFPLFAGGTIQAAVRESTENYKGKELTLAYTRRAAEKEVRTLFDTYSSYNSQFKALKEAADLADANYKEQSKDYRYGLVSNLEVLQAMNSLQENKRAMDKTFFLALKTYAQLEASLGINRFEKDTP